MYAPESLFVLAAAPSASDVGWIAAVLALFAPAVWLIVRHFKNSHSANVSRGGLSGNGPPFRSPAHVAAAPRLAANTGTIPEHEQPAGGTGRQRPPGLRREEPDRLDHQFLKTSFEMLPSFMDQLFSAQTPPEIAEALLKACVQLHPAATVGVFLIKGEKLQLFGSETLKALTSSTQIPIGLGQIGFAAKALVIMEAKDFKQLSNLDRAAATEPTGLPDFEIYFPIIRPRIGVPQGVVAVSGFSGKGTWRARVFQLLCTAASIALEQANKNLRALDDSKCDPLSGLPTKKQFLRAGAKILEECREPLSLCIFEIDNFQKLTDVHGEDLGGRIIADVAGALRRHLKDGETAARYGDEEFAFLLRASPPQALLRCEALRIEVSEKRFAPPDGSDLAITLSGGIAVRPGDGIDLEALLKSADQRLYQSRTSGHNQITLPSLSLQQVAPGL